jgi:hypothetical protein
MFDSTRMAHQDVPVIIVLLCQNQFLSMRSNSMIMNKKLSTAPLVLYYHISIQETAHVPSVSNHNNLL